MAFDLAAFARQLIVRPGHAEVLACACRTTAGIAGQPAFAACGQPGQPWERFTVVAAATGLAPVPAAARSAMHALHRRLLMAAGVLRLEPSEETSAIFRGLFPDEASTPPSLVALPLRTHRGRLSGLLVAGAPPAMPETALQSLQTVADLVAPALDAAWLHGVARRDQERLRLFSETMGESLWDWDLAQGEVWWGGNLEQVFGSRIQVSRRDDWRRARIHPGDVDRVMASFDSALAGQASSWDAEYRLHGPDENPLHVREHAYFLREVDGRTYRAVGTIQDISALRELLRRETDARAEAERASLVKDQFLAMLGHELRNPLAPIVSVLSVLERQAGGADRNLEIPRRQTQHLVRLVDDLLDVARISRGRVELTRSGVSLQAVVQRAVEMVQPLFEQRDHRVSLDIGTPIEVDVDAARLTQVFSNLLVNAARYTEPGGHLRVDTRTEDGQAVVTVTDDGIGIAPDVLPTIFEMFTQGRQALDRAQGGLGLGLSIVRNIVALHGGSVAAASEGPGRGTAVVVRLPLADAKEAATVPEPAPGPAVVQPLELLIVDDNEDAADLLAQLLAAEGHRVRVAYDPMTALRFHAEQAPDIAMIDIGLPTMDGFELVRRMRQQPGPLATKFIAVTGYGLASDRLKASDAGFDEHLVKPVAIDRLERLLDDFAGRSQAALGQGA